MKTVSRPQYYRIRRMPEVQVLAPAELKARVAARLRAGLLSHRKS